MNAKFQLQLDKTTGEKLVTMFHSIHYRGVRFRISSGVTVIPEDWDKENQLVRKSGSNHAMKNRKLKKQQNELEEIMWNLDAVQRPGTKENVLQLLNWGKKTDEKIKTPVEIFKIFIEIYCEKKNYRTIQAYTTTLKNLTDYQTKIEETLSFQHFNIAFGEKFKAYLLDDVKVFDNTASNRIKHLKTYLKWANELAYCKTEFFKQWKVKKEDGKPVFFLKKEEIELISNTQFIDRLDRVRDLLLIGCYSGLRYADINRVKQVHVQDGLIKIVTQKTGEYVEIPIITELQTILNKYWNNNEELPTISNQKGNKYIQELVKITGIKRPFIYIQKKDGKAIEQTYEAWEMCSWHTARHSFATIAIQQGISIDVIRRVLGHTTLKMLLKYLQNDPEHAKQEMKKMSKTDKIK